MLKGGRYTASSPHNVQLDLVYKPFTFIIILFSENYLIFFALILKRGDKKWKLFMTTGLESFKAYLGTRVLR